MAEERRPPRRAVVVLRWLRRASQLGFLALFLYLLVVSTYPATGSEGQVLVRPEAPVEAFFRFDPLAALLSILASHQLYFSLLPALATLAVTVVFGRAVCGWVCPLGTLNHALSWLLRPKSRSDRGARNRPAPFQAAKYYVLAACVGAALLGSAAGGWVDPMGLLTRGLGLFVIPALDLMGGGPVDAGTTSGLGGRLLGYAATAEGVLGSFRPHRTHGGWLIGALLIAVLAANAWVPRFWCRALCPLGALLGLVSRVSALGMRKDHGACIQCGRCEEHCQGADQPRGGEAWRQGECVLCLNCESSCPARVISFRLLPEREPPGRVSVGRRRVLAATAAGAALVPLSRVGEGLGVADDPRLIRPPGAMPERGLLARCVRCGQCMRSCPTNAIHPALTEAGLEGLWTPILIMRVGFCEPSCVTCGQVCPTGAIRTLSEEEKLGRGDGDPIRIGTAFIDRGRCLPWAMGTPCIVCEEFCPTTPKAIRTEEVEERADDGTAVTLRRPRIDPALCTGCGACEHVCPVRTVPAIAVTSVGETRSGDNQILLRRRREPASR